MRQEGKKSWIREHDELVPQLRDAVYNGVPTKSDIINALVPEIWRSMVGDYAAGVIAGSELRKFTDDIFKGFNTSLCSSIEGETNFETPEQYMQVKYREWDKKADAFLGYMERWQMYRAMFEEIHCAQKLSGGKYLQFMQFPDGHYTAPARTLKGKGTMELWVRRDGDRVSVKFDKHLKY